jgi:transposase InsO family protein
MLQEQYGIKYGRDKLFNLLEREKMLIRQRHRKPRTTWSGHIFPVYPNLVREIVPTRPNEVWVSDITYIKVSDKFWYLFLITDMYSRKIVGWSLAQDMQTVHAIEALYGAIEQREASTLPTIHHSDKGTQYCCAAYVDILKGANIEISMTEKGDPRENAYAERINGTIKNEFLKRMTYTELTVRMVVENVITAYNNTRPHASIQYKTPQIAHEGSGKLKRTWKRYPWYHKKISEKSANFAVQPTKG